MGIGKGSQTTTNTTTSSADPQAAAAYRALLDRAAGVASTPYQSYSGELTAPVNSQQSLGINNLNANAGYALPFVNQATGLAANAGQPLTASDIAQYQSPYTQSVVDATQAQFAKQNGQQQAALTGNAISQGALGGNRVGVAQANLAGAQQASQAPVIAGLYNQGYSQALQAAQGQQQMGLNAAYALGNLGVSGQNAALSGANAQVGAGTLQQTTQQAQDTAAYNQFLQQMAYPFQTTQWLAGLQTGVGSQLGGTSNGSTTAPSPSPWSQIAGLGLAAASLFKDGGAVRGYDSGGQVATPYGGAPSWVPLISVHGGAGAPRGSAPSPANTGAQQIDPAKLALGVAGVGNMLEGPAWGGGSFLGGDAWGGSSAHPAEGLTADDYGPGFAGGGGVPGLAVGGVPPVDFGDAAASDPQWVGPGLAVAAPWELPATFDSRFDAAFPHSGLGPVPALAPDSAAPTPAVTAPAADADQSFNDRFGTLPPATQNLDFQDRYIADNGVSPASFAGDTAPIPASPRPGLDVAPADDARTAVASISPPVMAADDAADGSALGYAGPPVAGPASDSVAPSASGAPPSPQQAEHDFHILTALGFPPLSAAARSGLLTAGLAMMASRSPNFLQAVGEGGLAGVGAYTGSMNAQQKAAMDQRRIDLEAQRLSQDADRAAKDLQLRTASQQETARHNKVTEQNTADRLPAGYTRDANGKVVLEPGFADATTELAKAKAKAPIDDDTARFIARQYLAGDKSVTVGLARTPENMIKLRQAIKDEAAVQGMSPSDVALKQAEFQGLTAGQRKLGNQEAGMMSAAMEAKGAIDLARPIINKVPRTSFLPLNKLIQGYQDQTLDPDQAELYTRVQGIINTYSAVMARGANITTDAARHKAEMLLNTAGNPAVLNRQLDTLESEINMAIRSPEKVRELYRSQFGKGVIGGPGDHNIMGVPANGGQASGVPAGAPARQVRQNGHLYQYNPATQKYEAVQ